MTEPKQQPAPPWDPRIGAPPAADPAAAALAAMAPAATAPADKAPADPAATAWADQATPDEGSAPGTEPGTAATAGPTRPTRGPLIAVLGVVAAMIVGGAVMFGGLAATGNLRPGVTPSPEPTPTATPAPTEAASGPIGNRVGSPDAPVSVEYWADYQCPFCRLENAAFGPALMREFVLSGRAQLVFRDFAFLGQESMDAAVAARCAGRQDDGAYWRYHDVLFVQQQGENQGAFSRENLVTLARVAGLDQAAFTTCLDDTAVVAEVTAETEAGRSLGVESTPTTRIVGPGGTRMLKGFSSDWTEIAKAIVAVETVGAASPEPGLTESPGPGTSVEPGATPAPEASADAAATPPASASPEAGASPDPAQSTSP